MRHAFWVLFVACRSQPLPDCSVEACEAVCAAERAEAEAALPEGAVRVSAYEVGVLGALREVVREPMLTAEGMGFVICEGGASCDRVIAPTSPETALSAPGPYRVDLKVRVPSVGKWELEITSRCSNLPDEQQEVRRISLEGRTGDVLLEGIARYNAPIEGPSDVRCYVFASVVGKDYDKAQVRMLLPGTGTVPVMAPKAP